MSLFPPQGLCPCRPLCPNALSPTLPGKHLLAFKSLLTYNLLGETFPQYAVGRGPPHSPSEHVLSAVVTSLLGGCWFMFAPHPQQTVSATKPVGFTVCVALHPCTEHGARHTESTRETPVVKERSVRLPGLSCCHLSSRWPPRAELHWSSDSRTAPTATPQPPVGDPSSRCRLPSHVFRPHRALCTPLYSLRLGAPRRGYVYRHLLQGTRGNLKPEARSHLFLFPWCLCRAQKTE